MVPQPQGASLRICGATIVTMNDTCEVIAGDVLVRDGRIAAVGAVPSTERANGRLRAAFAPRFAVSCSQALLEGVAALSQEHGLVVHTHASENHDEIALIRERTGRSNIDYLAHTPRLCLAHCVWVDDYEQSVMAEHDVKVLHCPGSNLKLGSGLAPTARPATTISTCLRRCGWPPSCSRSARVLVL
ncbi:MAG: hypothetical protein EXQ51_03800 [Acidobacteria bacterium]|nr:hypothetical protein [Acidobacteriota bacterium]